MKFSHSAGSADEKSIAKIPDNTGQFRQSQQTASCAVYLVSRRNSPCSIRFRTSLVLGLGGELEGTRGREREQPHVQPTAPRGSNRGAASGVLWPQQTIRLDESIRLVAAAAARNAVVLGAVTLDAATLDAVTLDAVLLNADAAFGVFLWFEVLYFDFFMFLCCHFTFLSLQFVLCR
jgi:hypothetical protein